ncbi:HAD-IC family P-type ATPase, partial [Acidimicrobiaceae bacterium USS-CC1]|nr:HAD-IC family P-type ATPase [Acidiferrimicrobium australe]
LPAAVTITLAIGMTRMAARRAVIRHLPAVETLGSTTVVCSDKTGTLTRNQMTVRAVWTPGASFTVTGSGYDPTGDVVDDTGAVVEEAGPLGGNGAAAPHPGELGTGSALWWTLAVGAACNDAHLSGAGEGTAVVGDPTEGALLVAAAKAGVAPAAVRARFPRVATLPFSSERRYMATLHDDRGARLVLAKGAVERIVELSRSMQGNDGREVPVDAPAVLAAAEAYAAEGLRVLATAVAPVPADYVLRSDAPPAGLVLTGLQAMLDPPREEAATAVASCHSAGIAVKMVTGDHASTAVAVAARLGVLADAHGEQGGQVLTGAQLSALGPDDYPAAVDRAAVFARVSPEQKLRLVQGLQAQRHVVAMTGDGVNDAPALRQADIGVAMGRGGTEVAKDAADMILTDDDFATIEAAVEEGRGVFDNLTKFIAWTLPTNMAEGFVILIAILAGATLPLVPVQILWINMTTAVALGLTLAFEPKEPGIMRRAPRDPRRPLLTGSLLVRIAFVSALLVGGTSWLFYWEQSIGSSVAVARTAALNLFVAVEAAYLFACRSLTGSVWRIGFFSNRWVVVGVAVQAVGQAAITYLPAMNDLFGTAPLGAGSWLRILALAAAATLGVAAEKRARRRYQAA